jgi:hypothetical protein
MLDRLLLKDDFREGEVAAVGKARGASQELRCHGERFGRQLRPGIATRMEACDH